MTKPLCIIVDDEEFALANLRDSIEELDMLEIERAYLDPDKFLVQVDQLKSEIIFLDLEMPINGVEVARKLKDKIVIFVSGFTERGYETFDVNAVDFVPKPIRVSRLKQAIEKAYGYLKPGTIVLKTQESKREEVSIDEIVFISTSEDDRRDKEIELNNGKKIVAKNVSMEELSKKLPKNIIQVHKSTMVNLDYAKKLLDTDTIGLVYSNDQKVKEINLGNSFREYFFAQKPQFK